MKGGMMKFNDGQWLLHKGVSMDNPIEIWNYEICEDSVTVFAPLKHVNGRGDTIDGGLITIRYSSPLPEIIRVQIFHFMGGVEKRPYFILNTDDRNKIKINDNPGYVELISGSLRLKITKEKYSAEFFNNDTMLTMSKNRSTGYMKVDEAAFMREQLELKAGECVYGLGERFTSFVKNGQVVDIWNEDGGTNSEQTYKNIPFYMTNKGYGVFVNHSEKVSFEVASESVTRVQFGVPGEHLDYFLINGPAPKDIIRNYTSLTGRPALPPTWSFGLWLSTSFTTSYDEKTVTGFIDGMKDRDIPLSVFHFDCFWMKEYHLTDLEWNEKDFPDPEGMIGRLKARGLKICLWINSYISQRSRLFKEGKEKGYLLKKKNGDIWQWNKWQAGMGIVDFTNPDACRWYSGYLERLLDMGVDSFKTDFGERIPTDVVYHDGSDPEKMHNYYTYLFNKLVFELIERKRGKGDAVVFARSATVGSQKFPLHWGGDCWANYESMAESLRGGLSLCLSGFGFWSHDIGGFENKSPSDVYKRWVAFGLLSSHSRLHGSSEYKVPWLYDDESVDVLRFFTKLKCSLMPYLFSLAVESVNTGIPVMRPMMMEFPDDPGCNYLDMQYMLGNSLLVAPVFSADGKVDYYLPEGNWTDYFTGNPVSGGRWIKSTHDFMSLPLYVRENSIIAAGNRNDRPDYDYSDNVTLHVYRPVESVRSTAVIYDGKAGRTLSVSVLKSENSIVIESEGSGKKWSMVIHGLKKFKECTNAVCKESGSGIVVVPEKLNGKIIIDF
jgi:alpha-D-xyloside xylohydrolase